MHKPTFRQLQIFAAMAKHKSFTRAAEELFLTQSTVSTQLKQLAELIGSPLWEQIGKKITLTQTGERVYQLCHDLEKVWKIFENEMVELNCPEKGRVVVSCVNTCQYFLPRIIGHFRNEFPEIDIVFKVFNRQKIMDRIHHNLDDLYILDYVSEDLDVKAIPFVDNPLVVLANATHPLAEEKIIPLKALENEVFLVREPGSGTRRETEIFLTENNIKNKHSMEMGSNEAIKQGILGGLGIGILSLYTSTLELRLGLLSTLNVENFPLVKKWNIAYPSGKVINPVTRTFLEFLKIEGRQIASSLIAEAEKGTTSKINIVDIAELTTPAVDME